MAFHILPPSAPPRQSPADGRPRPWLQHHWGKVPWAPASRQNRLPKRGNLSWTLGRYGFTVSPFAKRLLYWVFDLNRFMPLVWCLSLDTLRDCPWPCCGASKASWTFNQRFAKKGSISAKMSSTCGFWMGPEGDVFHDVSCTAYRKALPLWPLGR